MIGVRDGEISLVDGFGTLCKVDLGEVMKVLPRTPPSPTPSRSSSGPQSLSFWTRVVDSAVKSLVHTVKLTPALGYVIGVAVNAADHAIEEVYNDFSQLFTKVYKTSLLAQIC